MHSKTEHATNHASPSPQISPKPTEDSDADTEESHERKLARLMTVHLSTSTTNLSGDIDTNTHALTPAVEFLLGLHHEQTLIFSSIQDLEARITRIETKVWALSAADCDNLRALREVLVLSEKLCFGLFVADLVVWHISGEKNGDWNEGLEEVRDGVGRMVEVFDREVERLGVGV
jgi:hypothetical protein